MSDNREGFDSLETELSEMLTPGEVDEVSLIRRGIALATSAREGLRDVGRIVRNADIGAIIQASANHQS